MNEYSKQRGWYTHLGGRTHIVFVQCFFFITKTVYFSPKESNTQKMGSWSHHCLIRAKVAAQNRDQILHINAESVSDTNNLDSVDLNTLPGYSWEKLFQRLWEGKCIPQKANCQKKQLQLHGPLLTIWVKAVVLLLCAEVLRCIATALLWSESRGFFFLLFSRDV